MNEDRPSSHAIDLLRAQGFAGELAERDDAYRGLLLHLLTVMDAFDRLLDPGQATLRGDWRDSVRLIAGQLADVLAEAGVEPVDCDGAVADPRKHEVVDQRPAAGAEEAVILEVLTRGYQWRGRVLRRPQVITAQHSKEEKS